MYKIEMFFSEEEMISFLESRGYTISDFGVWDEQGVDYKSEIVSMTIKVAHKDDLNPSLTEYNNFFGVSSSIGISTVFNKEMKNKLLFN